MNIAHLLLKSSQDKSKINFLSDICTVDTLFIFLCETFLSDDITDPEVYLPGYSISRCDRANRIGGGVCIYVKDSISSETCVSFSNSTCELLILKLVEPELIIILLYIYRR